MSTCSSPVNRMKRMVRFGLRPDCAMMRAASSVAIEPVPLSVAPVPKSHESRWAPTITTWPGCSVPLISATVFHWGTDSVVILVWTLLSSCGATPASSSRSNSAYSSCATTICGSGSTRVGEPLMLRRSCSLPPSSTMASAPVLRSRNGWSVLNCWMRARRTESIADGGPNAPRNWSRMRCVSAALIGGPSLFHTNDGARSITNAPFTLALLASRLCITWDLVMPWSIRAPTPVVSTGIVGGAWAASGAPASASASPAAVMRRAVMEILDRWRSLSLGTRETGEVLHRQRLRATALRRRRQLHDDGGPLALDGLELHAAAEPGDDVAYHDEARTACARRLGRHPLP